MEMSLVVFDFVEVFMGLDWIEVVRGFGCVGIVVMLFKRWVLKIDESIVDGDEVSECEEEDEDDREVIWWWNDKVVFLVI